MDNTKLISSLEKTRKETVSLLDRLNNVEGALWSIGYSLKHEKQEPIPTPITDLAGAVYAEACTKGWWDNDREFPEVIALCHSELSEALEEYRAGRKPLEVYYREDGKPEGIAMEMIDTIIRILDWLGSEGADVDALLAEKFLFNTTRPARHGGKKA